MKMLTLPAHEGIAPRAIETKSDRLRSLQAMLLFAAEEAQALGEGQLSHAIEQALRTAEDAVHCDLGRPYTHDA